MKVARPVAFGLGVALAIAVGVQGASGAPAALHVKITGKDWARQLGPGIGRAEGPDHDHAADTLGRDRQGI